MINLENNIKKKLFIFDLDGVLIDSKNNMRESWLQVKKNFFIEVSFENYFQYIGIPFYDILNKLKIYNKQKEIKKCYDFYSKKNLIKIKFYKNVINILKRLKKKNCKICIVTSKDKIRTYLILKEYINLFSIIQCPNKSLKGKPEPDHILYVINKLNIDKKDSIYIGDTNFDYIASKKAKIDFVFADWGYGNYRKYKYSISTISEILKFC